MSASFKVLRACSMRFKKKYYRSISGVVSMNCLPSPKAPSFINFHKNLNGRFFLIYIRKIRTIFAESCTRKPSLRNYSSIYSVFFNITGFDVFSDKHGKPSLLSFYSVHSHRDRKQRKNIADYRKSRWFCRRRKIY